MKRGPAPAYAVEAVVSEWGPESENTAGSRTPPEARLQASLTRRILGSRLVQFVAIGGVIFAVAPAPSRPAVVSVRRETLNSLVAADPSRAEKLTGARAREIEQRYLEDEILYREGLRLGFDKDDGIIRQRVVQKVLFLAEEAGGASRTPTESELRDFFTANQSRFARPASVRFRHVFARQRELLPRVPEGDAAVGGEISPVGPEIDEELPQIEMTFGAPFASAVAALSPGSWSVPIQSAFGWHLVRVIARADGRPARFEEVRSRVLEQFSVYRRQEAIARYLTGAFGKYRVDVDGKPLKSFVASRRLAYRGVPSGED